MKAHFFDLDTIIRIDNKVWIIDKKNPNNPILKISQSDFNLIRKGIYRSHNQRLSLNGTNYWFPEEIMNQIKIKSKRIKFDLSNLGFSMQEFSNSEIIKDLNYEINLDLFNHIKNTTDHIYIICSKNNKRNYEIIIEKIEDKLHDLGLEIKNYYFISETFYNRNQDDITFKKVRILLQHLVGYKTEGDKFIDEEIENYDNIYYYDDDIDSVNLSTTLNDFFKVVLDNTDKTVSDEITKKLKGEENHLYVNYVSPNVVNRLQTKKVLLQVPNIIKTFESFNWKKG
jgi:hypothetical protein